MKHNDYVVMRLLIILIFFVKVIAVYFGGKLSAGNAFDSL